MAEQQKNMDYLNSTGDKFVKSLPRQKSEQLRSKLADLNDKWRDINLHAEKRQNQVRIFAVNRVVERKATCGPHFVRLRKVVGDLSPLTPKPASTGHNSYFTLSNARVFYSV